MGCVAIGFPPLLWIGEYLGAVASRFSPAHSCAPPWSYQQGGRQEAKHNQERYPQIPTDTHQQNRAAMIKLHGLPARTITKLPPHPRHHHRFRLYALDCLQSCVLGVSGRSSWLGEYAVWGVSQYPDRLVGVPVPVRLRSRVSRARAPLRVEIKGGRWDSGL